MSRNSTHWRWTAAVLLALIAGLALWLNSDRTTHEASTREQKTTATPAPVVSAETSAPATPVAPAEPPPITIMSTATELGAAVANRDNPSGALQGVDQALLFYRRAFGENPVGQNEDVTAAILGANPGRAAFLPPDSRSVKNGKLLDAWGTPYWFHPLSGKEMEIRSAGPDRELFTSDDLILK